MSPTVPLPNPSGIHSLASRRWFVFFYFLFAVPAEGTKRKTSKAAVTTISHERRFYVVVFSEGL